MNYGFQKPEITEEDYVFGGTGNLGLAEYQPSGQWDKYLPTKEMQKRHGVETYSCVSFGTLNCVEILLKRLWDLKDNYSDRYLAIMSETKPTGNSPQKVAEALRKNGCIPEEMLPFSPDIDNWDEYQTGVLSKHLVEGRKWLQNYVYKHDWVFTGGSVKTKQNKLKQALKSSPCGVSVNAWKMKNGYYYKDKGDRDNHWCTCYGYKEGKYWKIFDHYDNTKKKLDWDYNFGYAKRYVLEKNLNPEQSYDFLTNIINAIRDLITSFVKDKSNTEEDKQKIIKDTQEKLKLIKDNMKPQETAQQCLLRLAKDNLDRDITPEDNIPDEVACAETVSTLIKKVAPDFPIIPHTMNLYKTLNSSLSFEPTLDLEPGNIIVSPTGHWRSNGSIIGHTGIILEGGKIASNNSFTGKFESNYTISSWVNRYRVRGGYPLYVFKMINKNVKISSMKNKQLGNGVFKSSQDPDKLSLTIQGLIGAVVSILITLFGDAIPYTTAQATEIGGQLSTVAFSIITLVGLIRKPLGTLGRAIENQLGKSE